MTDGQEFCDFDWRCPVHGGDEAFETNYNGARVMAFKGCCCAVFSFAGVDYYYSNRAAAVSVAVMKQQLASSKEW